MRAAQQAIATRGRSASLTDIAKLAGVTKGGLLYHFGSKEELLEALAEDVIEAFENMVVKRMDPNDQQPGRTCRAYIRATMAFGEADEFFMTKAVVVTTMMAEPHIEAMFRRSTESLWHHLYDDGLPRETVTLVVAAADGASAQAYWGGAINPLRHNELLQTLIALTRQG